METGVLELHLSEVLEGAKSIVDPSSGKVQPKLQTKQSSSHADGPRQTAGREGRRPSRWGQHRDITDRGDKP